MNWKKPLNWVVKKCWTRSAVLENAIGDIKFQANLMNDLGGVITTTQVYFFESANNQDVIKNLSKLDIQDYDSAVREQMTKELKLAGGTVTSWHGSSRVIINNMQMLISEYSRVSNTVRGHFRVRIIRMYNGSRSFSVAASYHEEELLSLRPIIDKIISTIRCERCY